VIFWACAICFGSNHDPQVALVMMGMLALPFLMVGGMFTFLYVKGVFATPSVESNQVED